jgi:sterol desaturase/sphingolipid hydroxylase (fatty acid hydroxylase superfamily)
LCRDRLFGLNDEWSFVLLIWCCHNVTYYVWALTSQWLYKRNYFQDWKVQPSSQPDEFLLSSTTWRQLAMRVLVHPFMWRDMYRYIISQRLDDPLPSFSTCALLLLLSFYGFFALNAFMHKAFHDWPALYYYHKPHHEFKTTTGQAAEHHSLVDSMANAFITFLPALLLNFHPLLWCAHMLIRTWESVDTHTGYAFPFTPFRYLPGLAHQQEYHVFHHSVNRGSYSCLLFDHFTGTALLERGCYVIVLCIFSFLYLIHIMQEPMSPIFSMWLAVSPMSSPGAF